MEEANVSRHINKWTFDLEIEKLKEYSEKKKKVDLISDLGAATCKYVKSTNKYGDMNKSLCPDLLNTKTKCLLFYIFH